MSSALGFLMTGFTLDATSLKRIGEQTRRAEFQPTELRDSHTGKHVPPGTVARFRLLTSLETGKFAAARRLVLEPTAVDGEYGWLATDQEVPVCAGAVGWNNHWPDGAEVTCVATAAGWLVATDQLCGQFFGGDWAPIPYAILRIVQLTGLHRDTIQLGLPGTGDIAFWDDDYVVLGAAVPPSQREDPRPDEPRTTPRLRTVGCT
ncbi:MAG: hypothetical protein KIT22_20010, partial [Verrucomicrobiae bacterium]|nr:hypothetical protein [Verrucomicrobiae bacterium]